MGLKERLFDPLSRRTVPAPPRPVWSDSTRRITWIDISLFILAMISGTGLAFLSIYTSFTFAFLAVCLVLGGLVVIKWPEFGLLLIIFAIPLEDFNKIGDLGSLSLIKLLTIVVLGAYLVHHMVIKKEEYFVNPVQNIYVILLLLAILVSDFIAVDPATAVDQTFKLVRMAVFYFLVINIIRSKATLQRVIWAMIIAGFLSSGYGFYEYYFRPDQLQDMRVTGTLDDPMSFSYSMVILLPLVWYLITQRPAVYQRIFLAVAGTMFTYAIILSGTRSGIFAAIGALGLILIRQRRTVILNVVLILLIGGASILLMPDQVKTRLGLSGEVDRAAASSSERRMTYLTFGMRLFLENPIFGTGFGGFTEEYSHSEYQYFLNEDDVNRIAHNMYLEVITGAGILGLIPFLFFLFAPEVRLQRIVTASRPGMLVELAKMIQVSLAAYIFIGLFSSSQYDKLLWLTIGLATVIPMLSSQEEERSRLSTTA